MIVRATGRHIAQVAEKLSVVSRIEAEVAKIEDVRSYLLNFTMRGTNPEVFAMLDDEGPLWVFAVAEYGGQPMACFVAAEGGFERSLRRLSEMRALIAKIVRERGGLIAVTMSPHPNADRWFKLLGGKPVELDGTSEKVYAWG